MEEQNSDQSNSAQNPPTQTPPSAPSENKHKRSFPFPKILIAGVLVVIIFTALAGAYLLGKQSPNRQVVCTQEAKQCSDGSYVGRTGPKCEFEKCPEPTDQTGKPLVSPAPPKITEDPATSDWKTYIDSKNGFSIKYPPSYLPKTDVLQTAGILLNPSETLNNSKPLTVTYQVYVAVFPNNKNLSNSNLKTMFGNGTITSYTPELLKNVSVNETLVDGNKAYRINGCCGGESGTEADILILKDNKIYEIQVVPNQTEGKDTNKQLYEQILSTFRFD